MKLPPQLDFWHPVALSRDLGDKPVGVKLLGVEMVVFRTPSGVGVLHDVCPHRGMRLSEGWTDAGRLVCPYHGYSFDREGCGLSPGSPRRHLEMLRFDAVERCGAIWVKRHGADAEMPPWTRRLDIDITLSAVIEAPLEVVLDNFTEVEHTPTTHAFLGYRKEDMPHVTCELELTGDTVRVINVGPQKPLPSPLRKLLQIQPNDRFVDDWTTWFTPPHAVYDHYWRDPATGDPRPDKLVTVVHINPIDDATSHLFSFTTSVGPRSESVLWKLALKPITKFLVNVEVQRDKAILEKLADTSTSLRGRKLSRFDKPLAENRKRLDRLYWGRKTDVRRTASNS